MANTFTADDNTKPQVVPGKFRFVTGVFTMTDGNGAVATGLRHIVGGSVTPKTTVTGGYGARYNVTEGSVTIGSAASGDTFNVAVWGF